MRRVSHTLETLPPLTAEQQRDLARLAATADEDIDTRDVPEIDEADWTNGLRGRFYRPVKRQITVRIDADILTWLKSGGPGYQGRLNSILREKMLCSIRPRER